MITPPPELPVPLQQLGVPEAQRGGHPRDLGPLLGQPRIIHGVQGSPDLWAHDNGALDGQLEVSEVGPDQGQDLLHSVDLLPEEYIHGQHSAQPLEGVFDLVGHIISGQFPQHVVGYLEDDGLAGLTGLSGPALLRLHAQDRV